MLKSRERIDFSTSMQPMYYRERERQIILLLQEGKEQVFFFQIRLQHARGLILLKSQNNIGGSCSVVLFLSLLQAQKMGGRQ